MSDTENVEIMVKSISPNTKGICDSITKSQFLDYIEINGVMSGDTKYKDPKSSNIQNQVYIVNRPYNIGSLINLQKVNTHHMVCLNAKVSATVGLGFNDPKAKPQPSKQPKLKPTPNNVAKVLSGDLEGAQDAQEIEDMLMPSKEDEILDPFTNLSFQHTLTQVALDFEHGDGYLEIVRDKGGKLVGIHFLPASWVSHVIDPNTFRQYYIIQGDNEDSSTTLSGGVSRKLMCPFGKKQEFILDFKSGKFSNLVGINHVDLDSPELISELIHFPLPSNLSRHYGHTDFYAIVPYLELFRSMMQHKVDFFNNRGVPEFLATIIPEGAPLSKPQFTAVAEAFNANSESITKRRSSLIQLPKGCRLQIDKLGAEQIADTFKDDSETIAAGVVSAHGVPPLLANILMPGKIASANELPNALMSFQLLLIAKRQRIISRILLNTLGKEFPALSKGFKFRRITDLFDLEKMDTMARMKEPVVGSNRDLSEGLKD